MSVARGAWKGMLLAVACGGCGVGLDVELRGQQPVDALSATAIVEGALVTWRSPDGDPVAVELEPPDAGPEEVVRVFVEDGESAEVLGLDPRVRYSVRLLASDAAPISPSVSVQPFPATSLEPLPWVTLSNGEAGSAFGRSVAFVGDVDGAGAMDVAVGAPNASNGQALEGAAWIFAGEETFTARAPVRLETDEPYAYFGWHVAPGGDVDGDGLPDVLVNAPFPVEVDDTSGSAAGVLHVALGGTTPALGPSFIGTSNDLFGSAAVGAQLDGDGEADILVGGPGESYASVLSSSLAFTVTSTGGRLGFAVAVGDLDGDADLDLAIGEPLFGVPPDPGDPAFAGGAPVKLHQGRVRVFLSDGLGNIDVGGALSLTVGTAGQLVGTALAIADVDGDGTDDVIAGASPCAIPTFSTATATGAIFVWRGKPLGPGGSPDATLRHGLCLGRSVAAGDVDGDGAVDIVAGDPAAGTDDASPGEVRVFTGTLGGFPDGSSTAIEGRTGAALGASIAVANYDGGIASEVLAGAPGLSEAYLFRVAALRGPDVDLEIAVADGAVTTEGRFAPQDGPIVSYRCRWEWGDGASEEVPCAPNGAIPGAHTYATPGTYDVRLHVFSAEERFGEAVVRVAVE